MLMLLFLLPPSTLWPGVIGWKGPKMLSAHVELGYITGFTLCRCRRRHAARIDKEKKEWTIIGSRAGAVPSRQAGRWVPRCSLTDCAPHELHPPPVSGSTDP